MGLFKDNSLNDDKKQVIKDQLDIYKREQRQDAREEVLEANRELLNAKEDIREERNNLKAELAREGAVAQKDLELLEKDRFIQKKDDEIESEKYRATLLTGHTDLLEKNWKANADLLSYQKELTYTKANIDSLLASKDGIIAGLNVAINMYKEQMDYMQKVLAVAVGKIPTVDFSTIKFNIEQPAAQKGPQQDKPKTDQPKN